MFFEKSKNVHYFFINLGPRLQVQFSVLAGLNTFLNINHSDTVFNPVTNEVNCPHTVTVDYFK